MDREKRTQKDTGDFALYPNIDKRGNMQVDESIRLSTAQKFFFPHFKTATNFLDDNFAGIKEKPNTITSFAAQNLKLNLAPRHINIYHGAPPHTPLHVIRYKFHKFKAISI